jgi:hypothetical protein
MIKFINMKKIFYLTGLMIAMLSCTNQDIEFDDYAFQGVYFPFQSPLRTIILGDEALGDNTIDREHAFSIGASIGGMYSNTKDRVISIELAPELAANITDGDGNPLEILPSNYYSATFDKLVIPAGSFMGKVRVDLTDAFFQDPLTTGLHYVIPVRMTDVVGDTILSGLPISTLESHDPRISDDWNIVPKNYTLFGIKYINPTHGVYLLRGKRTNTADAADTYTYSKRFLDDNDMTKLSTKSLTENYMATVGGASGDAKYNMLLSFDEGNNSVVISQKDETTVVANGSGSFYSKDDANSEEYNGQKHRTIYLDYTYIDGDNTYQVKDSLVFVDTDVTFEDFDVEVIIP